MNNSTYQVVSFICVKLLYIAITTAHVLLFKLRVLTVVAVTVNAQNELCGSSAVYKRLAMKTLRQQLVLCGSSTHDTNRLQPS